MNIPTLIREQLRQFPLHYLNSKEQSEYRERLREKAVKKRRREINTLFTERDKLFLSSAVSEEREQQFRDKMKDLEAEIQAVENIEDEEIKIETEKPIELYSHQDNGGLLPADTLSPASVSSSYELDFYISGKVEQITDYFFIEMSIWSSILQEEVLVVEDAGNRDSLQEIIDRVVGMTYDVIVGNEWAFLQVAAVPDDADLFVSGEFIGSGSVEKHYVQPGEYTVSAEASGFERSEKQITVLPGETRSVQLLLEKAKEETLLISSEPGRADVYSGAVWLGRTPLLLPLPKDSIQRVMVVKRDFSPEYLNAGPGDAGSVNVQLSPFDFDSNAYVDKKRDQFYLSAGFFVLSFPLPFFLYSITEDLASGYSIAAQNQNIEEMEKKLRDSLNSYHAYVGSIVIAASLLFHTVYRLVEYISASELN